MSSVKCYVQNCLRRTWKWTCCASDNGRTYCCLSHTAMTIKGSEPSISSGQSGQHSLISKRSVISQDNLTLGSGNNSTKQNCAGELKSTSEYELSAMTITQQPGVNTSSKGHSVNCSSDSTDKYYSADNNNRSNAVELSTTTTTKDAVTLLATDSSVITNKLLDSNVQTHGIVSSENSDINGYSKRTILPNGGAINDDDVFVTASTDKVGNGVVQGGCNRTVSNSSDQFPVDKKVSISAQKTVIPEAKRKDSILDKFFESCTVKDGHFFIAMTHRHTENITARCDETERYLIQTDVPEEACGKIRAAIGKAHLLTSKRFQQFIGLCQENLHPKGGHSPTIQDLAGFWDMVYLQVEDVSNSFDEIEEMKENDWKEVENSQFKKRSSSCSSQKSVNSVDYTETKAPAKTRTQKRPTKQKSEAEKVREEAARKTREEARKRLMQAKRAARKRLLSGGHEQEAAIEIFVPENT